MFSLPNAQRSTQHAPRGWWLVAALIVVASAPASAQHQAEPIIVSATRLPLNLGSLPVAVTVLRGEDLRLRGVTTVADALNDITGAYLAQTGSQGATTSLFLRGGESKYVKVLIDGVPANDPGGVYDFASLTTDNIERIEVVRGPVSVVHGADAVTGVVQIITRRGTGAPRVETSASVGMAPRATVSGASPDAMRTASASWTLAGSVPAGAYSLAVARHVSTGLYAFNNQYQNTTVSGSFAFTPAEGTELRLALRLTDYRFHYPTNSAGDIADSNAHRVEDRSVVGVEIEQRHSASVRSVLALNSSINDGGTDDGPDGAGNSFVSQDKVRRRGAEWRLHWGGAAVAATAGVSTEFQDQRSQSQSQSAFGPFYSVFKAGRRNAAVFGEAVISVGTRLTATMGARLDDNERFGTFATGRAGVLWRPLASTRVRATAGTAFREPSFFENYATGFVTGNPDLSPEQARVADVGVEQELINGRLAVAATLFAQRFQDMIDYSGLSACGYSYCNVARADANGIELETKARVAGALTTALGATFLQTKVVEPGYTTTPDGLYVEGQPLIRRPGTKWNAELTWRNSHPLSATARVTVVGARADRDYHFPSSPVTLPSYSRVDVGAEYRLVRGALTMRVENLLDVEYQNVFNFLAPRRVLSLGVRLTNQ